jgi:hypothetical protein
LGKTAKAFLLNRELHFAYLVFTAPIATVPLNFHRHFTDFQEKGQPFVIAKGETAVVHPQKQAL